MTANKIWTFWVLLYVSSGSDLNRFTRGDFTGGEIQPTRGKIELNIKQAHSISKLHSSQFSKFSKFSSIAPHCVKLSFVFCMKRISKMSASKQTLLSHQLYICYEVVCLFSRRLVSISVRFKLVKNFCARNLQETLLQNYVHTSRQLKRR